MSDEDQKSPRPRADSAVPSATPGPRESLAQSSGAPVFRPPARPAALERAAQEPPAPISPADIQAPASKDPADDLLGTIEAAMERKAARQAPANRSAQSASSTETVSHAASDSSPPEVPGIQIESTSKGPIDRKRLLVLGGGALGATLLIWGVTALILGSFTRKPDTDPPQKTAEQERRAHGSSSSQGSREVPTPATAQKTIQPPPSRSAPTRLPPPVRRVPAPTAGALRPGDAPRRVELPDDQQRIVEDRVHRGVDPDDQDRDLVDLPPPGGVADWGAAGGLDEGPEPPVPGDGVISRMRDGSGVIPPEDVGAPPYDGAPAGQPLYDDFEDPAPDVPPPMPGGPMGDDAYPQDGAPGDYPEYQDPPPGGDAPPLNEPVDEYGYD